MAILLTANKSFRLPEQTALALERLAVITGRSQTGLISLLVEHFQAAELARPGRMLSHALLSQRNHCH